jgi:DNA-binding MarR family transcriptional regulator
LELLFLARRRPGLRVGEAASELHLAPNSVSALVHILLSQKLIERERDSEDRRVVRLSVSDEGRAVLRAWRAQRRAAWADAIAQLSTEERQTVAAALPALRHLVDALSADTAS